MNDSGAVLWLRKHKAEGKILFYAQLYDTIGGYYNALARLDWAAWIAGRGASEERLALIQAVMDAAYKDYPHSERLRAVYFKNYVKLEG